MDALGCSFIVVVLKVLVTFGYIVFCYAVLDFAKWSADSREAAGWLSMLLSAAVPVGKQQA
jgi:hypothetical protein